MNCWATGNDADGLLAETVRLTDATASSPRERAGMTLLRAMPSADGWPRERSGMKVLRKCLVHEAPPGHMPPLRQTKPSMLEPRGPTPELSRAAKRRRLE